MPLTTEQLKITARQHRANALNPMGVHSFSRNKEICDEAYRLTQLELAETFEELICYRENPLLTVDQDLSLLVIIVTGLILLALGIILLH